jgi:hypothetical protein
VAAARGLTFQSFTISPNLFDRLPLILSSVEGFQDITQCRQVAVVDDIREHADYLIAAHWGDVWLDDMGLLRVGDTPDSAEQVIAHALHKIEKPGRAWLLENLCAARLGTDIEGILLDGLRVEMAQLQHIEDADFRVRAFKTDNWSFRWTTASVRMFQPAAFVRLPFYDVRLADFFCTVPSQFMANRQLQIDYLREFAPDLAGTTWQTYDANLWNYRYFNSWLLPKRAAKKAWRLIRRKRIIERNWEVQLLGVEGRRGIVHWLLRPGLHIHSFVSRRSIEGLLDDFYRNPLADKRGYTVSMLLTFSVSLETFL